MHTLVSPLNMLPFQGILHCSGRDYPRIPRGLSIGCRDDNWPAAWKWVSGPTPSGLWLPYLSDHSVYAGTGSAIDEINNSWVWQIGDFQRSVQVHIQNLNPQQSGYYVVVLVVRPGFGSAIYFSDDLPWGNPATIRCHYLGGFIAEWSDLTDDFVIGRALYTDLTPDWCALSP